MPKANQNFELLATGFLGSVQALPLSFDSLAVATFGLDRINRALSGSMTGCFEAVDIGAA
jgi:hypothetical protein